MYCQSVYASLFSVPRLLSMICLLVCEHVCVSMYFPLSLIKIGNICSITHIHYLNKFGQYGRVQKLPKIPFIPLCTTLISLSHPSHQEVKSNTSCFVSGLHHLPCLIQWTLAKVTQVEVRRRLCIGSCFPTTIWNPEIAHVKKSLGLPIGESETTQSRHTLSLLNQAGCLQLCISETI